MNKQKLKIIDIGHITKKPNPAESPPMAKANKIRPIEAITLL